MLLRSTSALAVLFLATAAPAQDAFPSRPVTLIVPFSAGGTSDVIARLAAEQMGRALGQNVINENTAGAGGSTALTRAARAAPDGYTLAIGNIGTNAAAYTIYKDIKYAPEDFAPIGLVAKTVPVIAIKKDFPAKNLAEFIDYAKKNPGKVNLGHAGVGSSNYLICKAFTQAAGIETQLVSYRGAAPALNDLMGGQIDGVCDAAVSAAGAIQGGAARGLVISSPTRLRALSDVPTAAEAGLPGFQLQGWNAIFAPKGTPEPVIAKLNAALRTAVASEAFQKRMEELGSLPASGEELTPPYVAQFVTGEIDKTRKLLQ
ncbi:MAG TPA: tripartite tricarboxylate transporter substrate-binding protein [Beijerinckiaceae bacterium]|jgi:tripartite-type tricarboxylate transporter receptor subunit TctC